MPKTGPQVPDPDCKTWSNVQRQLCFDYSPFIISPRITFEVSVRLLGGLMALGYTIASILKRSSHVFLNDKVCVKIDWLEQLNRKYVQVQGKDRLYVKYVAEQLGLDGSYVPHTYIEQIQLEKLINDVMTLPDDLKTKLSIDNDLASSPKEALSRASADRRIKFLNRAHSFSTQRDKNLPKLTKLAVNNRRYDGRMPDSPAALANQGIITQLSEQISTLNERMEEFTSRIDEINSKISTRNVSASQQNLAEACNGSVHTPLFASGVGNGPLTGSLLPNSSSSSQLARESPIMEEVLHIARGQRQIMHQIDSLSKILHDYYGERSQQGQTDRPGRVTDFQSIGIPLLVSLAIGGIGILLFKTMSSQK
ncbi:Phosphoribulokinase/Uridine kinase family [Abeliophyllum distichum]|uniref:Phosphoribulokinase/Uridine kinase family n=1 Tax=Abeliophyllum distichum TaxID=126358 RepID=A0ABD1PFB9_9LAMI